jgi:AraC-like DNA-binding protein
MARLNDSRIGSMLGSVLGERACVRASTWTTSTLHAQHGVALFVTLETPLTVTDAAGRITRGRAVLVPPELAHSVYSAGPTLGICYDPERQPRLASRSRCSAGAHALDGRLARRLVEQTQSHRARLADPEVLRGIADEAAGWLATEPARPLDVRVAAAAEALRADEEPTLTVSRAHLAELFARDVGTSMRSYRLWHRLLRALHAFARGDATTAAHAAGFADLAHFSRTCRRMLGYTPTGLRDGV